MNPLIRLLLWLAGTVFGLLVAVALAAWLLIDPENYRPLIADTVAETTGRTLTLEGPIGLELFPCCSLTLDRAAIGNPPGFPVGEFASVQSATLSLKLWPLLTRRKIEIGKIKLTGVNANLLVRMDGRASWELPADAAPGDTAGDDAGGTGDLAIDGIEITSGRIAYRDEHDASGYVLDKLELATGDVRPGQPFELKLAGDLTDESDGTVVSLALDTKATVATATGKLVMAKPLLKITARGEAVPAREMLATLGAAELVLETEPETQLAARDFQGEFNLQVADDVAGDIEGSFVAPEARFTAGTSNEVEFPRLTAKFTVTGAEIPGETISGQIVATALTLDVDKSLGAVEALTANVNGIGATLGIEGGGRMTEQGANLSGRLELAPVSPRSLLTVLKEPIPKTADPGALTRLAGRADWSYSVGGFALSGIDFTLDQTRISGTLALRPGEAALTSFDLGFDAIDLDRYLEPESATATDKSGGDAAAEPDIPVETLRDLHLDGSLRFGKVVYEKLQLANVSARIRAKDGRLRFDPLSADLYGGKYAGAIAVDATGPTAALTLEQKLNAVQIGGPLRDVFQTDKLTGALTGSVSAQAKGNTSDALLASLDGTVALKLADGVYLGTDLWHEIRKARAAFRREAPPPAPAEPRTTIEAMEFAGDIRDGVMVSDQLTGQIPFIRMGGQGTMNLIAETLDYKLEAEVFAAPTFEDGTTFDDLTGLAIPLTLKGAMADPSVRVDIRKLASNLAQGKLKQRLLDRLGLGEPSLDGAGTGTTEPPKDEKPRDALKRSLRDLLGQ